MELWLTPFYLLTNTDPNRPLPCYTLFPRCLFSLLLSRPYLPGCKLRLGYSECARQRSLILLHLYLHAHCPRTILWFFPIQGDMKRRRCPSPIGNSNRIRWVRSSLRTNVVLRCYRYYQSFIRYSLCR